MTCVLPQLPQSFTHIFAPQYYLPAHGNTAGSGLLNNDFKPMSFLLSKADKTSGTIKAKQIRPLGDNWRTGSLCVIKLGLVVHSDPWQQMCPTHFVSNHSTADHKPEFRSSELIVLPKSRTAYIFWTLGLTGSIQPRSVGWGEWTLWLEGVPITMAAIDTYHHATI